MDMFPPDPIAAVTAADPYPYYRTLVRDTPLARSHTHPFWVAASASAVTAVLSSDLCLVRPKSEPVPTALLGSPAAAIFQHLVRMNDGERHDALKQAVATTLTSIDLTNVRE